MSRSSVESEYRGMSNASAELLWIQTVLSEIGIRNLPPPLLLCDNLSATYMAANPILHHRTKHIEIGNTHLLPMTLRFGGNGINDHVLFRINAAYSAFIACFHCGWVKASL